MPKQLSVLLYFVSITCATFAQDSSAEMNFAKVAEQNAVAIYHGFTGDQSRLYNGTEHIGYLDTIQGFAYYIDKGWQKGSLVYDGLFYEQVPMLYDLYKDEVVILHRNNYMLTLLSEKLKEFNLYDHHFVRHVYNRASQSPESSLSTGFYDYRYEGKISVLIKRVKLLDEKVTDIIVRKFLPQDKYYIFKEGTYHTFNSYTGLLKILQDKSKDIKRYFRKNKIKFRKDRENATVLAAKYYDTLK